MNTDKKSAAGTFQLLPYRVSDWSKGISLHGTLARWPRTVTVSFRLAGELDNIRWPQPASVPGRRHNLWQQTCFEMFLSEGSKAGYWEVNVNPYGCWNVYHFNSYRCGMKEEGRIGSPSWKLVKKGTSRLFSFTCTLDISKIIDDRSDIAAGLSTVLQGKDGGLEYWAAAHPGKVPDFHDHRSFIARLNGLELSTNKEDRV